MNRTQAHAVSVLAALLAAAPGMLRAEPTHVYRFDEPPPAARPQHAQVQVVSDPAPAAGDGCLRVTPQQGKKALLVLDVPEGVDMARQSALAFHLRLSPEAKRARLRWYAVDGENRVIFQRRALPKASGEWARIVLPLQDWRWGNQFVGDWSEVRKLALQVESDTGTFALDELRIEPGTRGAASAVPDQAWYLDLAFGDRPYRQVSKGDVLVATDATGKLSEQDLAAIRARLARIRKWVRRAFGDACRPVLKGQPVVLLIFADKPHYSGFFEALAQRWLATIRPTHAGGYTVQDICASTYGPAHGSDRPVWFHEGVHCMVTRELRLLTGVAEHAWMHEGLANYLQLCVYPESMDRSHYVRNFREGVGQKTFFRPLRQVMTERVSGKRYAQVASLVAFLLEEHPDWLRALASGLADGKPVGQILKACGTDFDKLQADWLAWGRKHFAPDANPPAGPGTHFNLPPEFAESPPPKPVGPHP